MHMEHKQVYEVNMETVIIGQIGGQSSTIGVIWSAAQQNQFA